MQVLRKLIRRTNREQVPNRRAMACACPSARNLSSESCQRPHAIILSRFLVLGRFFHQFEVIDPKLAPNQRIWGLSNDFQHYEACVLSGTKCCLLQTPRSAVECIFGEDVGSFTVSVRNRKTRTASTLEILRLAFGAEFVLGIRFYRDELSD